MHLYNTEIRTLDRLPYTRVPGERLRPLGQLSIKRDGILAIKYLRVRLF
jgi:hypothetical protein